MEIDCRSGRRNGKRVYLCLSGSAVVEAALVLPLITFFMVLVMQLILIPGIRLRIRQALYEDARVLSQTAYARDLASDRLEDELIHAGKDNSSEGTQYKEMLETGLDLASAKAFLIRELGPDYGENHGIIGGTAGILLTGSEIAEKDNDILLRAVCEVKLPFYEIFHSTVTLEEIVCTSAWLGESGEKSDEDAEITDDSQKVYITEHGEVYHRDRNCSYISVILRQVPGEQLEDLRNSSGHKYYPCEICAKHFGNKGLNGQDVYITEYGERFHIRADCSSIERKVQAIPISQVGNRRPCSKCGDIH